MKWALLPTVIPVQQPSFSPLCLPQSAPGVIAKSHLLPPALHLCVSLLRPSFPKQLLTPTLRLLDITSGATGGHFLFIHLKKVDFQEEGTECFYNWGHKLKKLRILCYKTMQKHHLPSSRKKTNQTTKIN